MRTQGKGAEWRTQEDGTAKEQAQQKNKHNKHKRAGTARQEADPDGTTRRHNKTARTDFCSVKNCWRTLATSSSKLSIDT